jgi:hypothetical protein
MVAVGEEKEASAKNKALAQERRSIQGEPVSPNKTRLEGGWMNAPHRTVKGSGRD